MKNRTVIPVFGEAIEIVTSRTSANYALSSKFKPRPQEAGRLLIAISEGTRFSPCLKGNSNSLMARLGSPSIAVKYAIRCEERTTASIDPRRLSPQQK
jgi:hypothetical protein